MSEKKPKTNTKKNDKIKEGVTLPPWIEKPLDRMKRQQKILK